MKKTLYLKFILAYLIFGFFGFVVVATFVSNMTMDHIKKNHAESLYKEAIQIANTYASDLYSNRTSLDTVKNQIDALAVYMNSTIWIINPSGRMVLDSSSPLDIEKEIVIENFDSTATAGSYYIVGTFFGRKTNSVYLLPSLIITGYRAMWSSICPCPPSGRRHTSF